MGEAGDPWEAIGALYALPGVAAAAIDLQDEHGVDVTLLLYLAHLDLRGLTLSGEAVAMLDGLSQPWRVSVVGPIRSARRAVGGGYRDSALYEGLKAVELEAEKQQLEQLRDHVDLHRLARTAGSAPLANMRAYLAMTGIAPCAAIDVIERAILPLPPSG